MSGIEIIEKYFPDTPTSIIQKLKKLQDLYIYWNARVNVISRKDIENLYERHVLHSLALAKIISLKPGTTLLDVGSGGGFPGIPLAIFFPEVKFTLVDSIAKKLKVIDAVAEKISLENVETVHERAEGLNEKFDFITGRAVTNLPDFIKWVKKLVRPGGFNDLPHGIFYWKGGALEPSIKELPNAKIYPLSYFFEENFFEEKYVVYVSF